MPSRFDQPVVVLSRTDGREPFESGADAPHRRVVSEIPVLRLPPDGPPVAARRCSRWPPPGSPADASDGSGGHLPSTENQRAAPGAQDLSLSAQGAGDRAAQPGLVRRHHLHPRPARVPVPGGDHGLGDAPCACLAIVQYHGRRVLCRGPGGGAGSLRLAGDHEYRPGIAVHRLGLDHDADRCRRAGVHGRPGPLHGQHLHRTSVAVAQIRGGLPARTDRRLQGRAGHPGLDRLLQSCITTPICLCC